MELHIWSGDWGLPSIDHRCLSAMAYCKFAGVPVEIKKNNNPWKSPNGEFPVLIHANGKETTVSKIFEALKKQDYNVDETLTPKQCADSLAFAALLNEKLLPAMLHVWWVDSKTYVELTRPWFAKAVGMPFSFYLPQRKRNNIIAQLRAPFAGNELLTESELENQVIRDAKECLNLLSTKLGNNDFFFGDQPTSLDAIIFGHLAPVLKMPLSNPLQVHLKACRNLVNFCQRILGEHFPLTAEEQEALRKQDDETRQRAAEQTEFPHRKRTFFLAGLSVILAMTAYALMSGLVQIEFVKGDQQTRAVPGESEVMHISSDANDDEQ